jgi:DNA-directed RNA polymerase subunit RPC12/RpoP
MTCPRCSAEFESDRDACPECGVRVVKKVSGVMKTSSVMIAAGDGPTFYRSVQDVPEPLRTQLLESTKSENSGTIVIADRAGKDQITQVIARRESARERKAAKEQERSETPAPDPGRRTTWLEYKFLGYSWVVWAGVLLFLAAACVIAAVFAMHA